MEIDIRVVELLASKICHDLVSPVSAINNGVELIEDIGGSVVDEAMKLIGDSGTTASRRLKLFRMAYGRGGSEESLAARDVRQVAEQHLTGGKISLIWPEGYPSEIVASQRGFLKTLLNAIILAEETLAYGGTITLCADGGNHLACKMNVVGRNAQLSPQLQEALDGTVAIDGLTPRSIQAYMVGCYAGQFGLELSYNPMEQDKYSFSLAPRKIVEAAAPLAFVSVS